MKQILIDEELLEQVLEFVEYHDRYWSGNGEHPQTIVTSLRTALEQPLVEPEMHEAMCPALTGCKCNCPTSPAFVDKAWAQFCGGVGRGTGAPYPGMIEAFEAHYGQSFTDRDWRNESSIWAAAWKAAKAQPAPVQEAVVTLFVGVGDSGVGLTFQPEPLAFQLAEGEHRLYAAPQAPQLAPPADVPMLTEEEIWNSDELIAGNAIAGLMLNDYAAVVRIIEAVVRQKAGLK